MEGLVWRTNHKSFSFCFLLLLLLLHARVSSHLCTLSSHSHFLSLLLSSSSPPSEKKSRFWELSILIEIINPFYSFPDFHFVRSIIEEKEAIESCVQWHLDVGWWWWWWGGGESRCNRVMWLVALDLLRLSAARDCGLVRQIAISKLNFILISGGGGVGWGSCSRHHHPILWSAFDPRPGSQPTSNCDKAHMADNYSE